MSQELKNIITNEKELRITSVELVDIINQFREEEFELLKEKGLNKKNKYAELRHDSFMTKIRKELEVLETLGLEGHQNILESSYINKQNKEQPCFSLNRDGMLQMLNSESAIVRAKTIQHINELEQRVEQLEEDLVEVSKIAVSDKEQKQREYETKKTLYSWRNIRTVLMACDYKNLEDTVTDVINFHVNVLKKNDRVYGYSNLDKTSYKQAVRDRVYNILDCVYNNTKDGVLRTVAGEVKETLIKDKIATINRSNGHVISGLQKEIESLRPVQFEDMVKVDNYAISKNSLNTSTIHSITGEAIMCNTREYKGWKWYFQKAMDEANIKELFSHIDWSKPVEISYAVTCHEKNDIGNFIDALQDVIQEYFTCDDKKFLIGTQLIVGIEPVKMKRKTWLYFRNVNENDYIVKNGVVA